MVFHRALSLLALVIVHGDYIHGVCSIPFYADDSTKHLSTFLTQGPINNTTQSWILTMISLWSYYHFWMGKKKCGVLQCLKNSNFSTYQHDNLENIHPLLFCDIQLPIFSTLTTEGQVEKGRKAGCGNSYHLLSCQYLYFLSPCLCHLETKELPVYLIV